jgi:hypothetical protein
MSTVIASKGVDGSKSSYFPANKGTGEWFEVDLNSGFPGEGLEFLMNVCGNNLSCLCCLKSSNVCLYDGAGNTEDTCERTTITTTIKPCSKSSPSSQPTKASVFEKVSIALFVLCGNHNVCCILLKATTTTVCTESLSKNPSTLLPTIAGGHLDPFSKVNIQTTSDTNPNWSEVPVFSGGHRNSVSISLLFIFGFTVILIVLDHL